MATSSSGPTPPRVPKFIPIVGIEKAVNDIVNLLKPKDELSLALVIFGCGGIGKTTLAEAALAKTNFEQYNYTKIVLHQEKEKNDFTSLQQQILKDCFPTYNNGKPVEFKDGEDAQDQQVKASQCENAKPVFIFVDNALRSLDVKYLFPTYTLFLPPRSRILLTTGTLAAARALKNLPMLQWELYTVQPLVKEDALKILLPDPNKSDIIEDAYLQRILSICKGVPLALKIVSTYLRRESRALLLDDLESDFWALKLVFSHSNKQSCSRLLDALERREEIKEDKIVHCLVDFVYGELDEITQEAFVDICCFFNNLKRQDVEHIVGARALTSLFEAGLITSIPTQETEDELIVHDVVLAKGQSLAKDTRITDVKSLCDAADEERLHQIKGIWLANDKSRYVLPKRHLSKVTKSLRVLALGDRMKFGKAIEELEFEELRFLRIGSNIPQLPVKLEALNNLKVFHGPCSIGGEDITSRLPSGLLAIKVMEPSVGK